MPKSQACQKRKPANPAKIKAELHNNAIRMLSAGIDIIDVKQMRRVLKRNQAFFLNKLFTLKEISRSKLFFDKARYFSNLFAFKESFAKAKGRGFSNFVKLSDIDVSLSDTGNRENLPPEVLKACFKNKRINLIDVEYSSIKSHIVCRLVIDIKE